MAFTLSKGGAVRYSSGEQRIFALLSERPVTTTKLTKRYYNGNFPSNGQKSIISFLNYLTMKVKANKEPFVIKKSKRNGPHPIEVWIARK